MNEIAKPRLPVSRLVSISSCCCISAYAALAIMDWRLVHWFAAPVIMCGIMVGVDAMRWVFGEYDVFDLRGMIGLYGVHFFFTAPLLTVVWDAQLAYPYVAVQIDDLRPWLGLMAVLNFAGLVGFLLAEKLVFRRVVLRSRNVWCARPVVAVPMLLLVLFVAFAAQMFLFWRRGGLLLRLSVDERSIKAGEGIFRVLAIAFPVLFMYLIVIARRTGKEGWLRKVGLAILICMLVVWIFVAFGLTGSRAATVFPVFWVVGIYHFSVNRIGRKVVLIGVVTLFVFAWVYAFYKWGGAERIQRVLNEGVRSVAADTGVGWRGVLIGDMSRANVQAQMVYVVTERPYGYRYRYGATIVGDVLAIIPRWLVGNDYNRDGYSGKEVAGTELLLGPGSFVAGKPFNNARFQYGVGGQAILNYGIWSVPLAYTMWGLCVGWCRAWIARLPQGDLRLLVAPGVINLVFLALIFDINNLIHFTLFRLVLPVMVLCMIAESKRRSFGNAGCYQS